jgi:hypothetical protein
VRRVVVDEAVTLIVEQYITAPKYLAAVFPASEGDTAAR